MLIFENLVMLYDCQYLKSFFILIALHRLSTMILRRYSLRAFEYCLDSELGTVVGPRTDMNHVNEITKYNNAVRSIPSRSYSRSKFKVYTSARMWTKGTSYFAQERHVTTVVKFEVGYVICSVQCPLFKNVCVLKVYFIHLLKFVIFIRNI